MVEGADLGAGQEDRGAVVVGLEGPELRLDVVDGSAVGGLRRLAALVGDLRREGGTEDEDLLVQREVVDGVILNIEGRGRDRQRVRVRADCQEHVVRELLALARPGAAEDRLAELGVARGDRAVDGDHATAALGEGAERLLGVGRIRRELRLVEHDDVGLGQGVRRGDGRLRDLRAPLGQVSDRATGGLVVIADDQDAQRGGRDEGRREEKEETEHGVRRGRPQGRPLPQRLQPLASFPGATEPPPNPHQSGPVFTSPAPRPSPAETAKAGDRCIS